jgi:5-methylcytosine-specific restriction endonuclease McrA
MRNRSWTIKMLKEAVENSTSIRQVIAKLGLVEAGGNYDQVKKYIKENSISTEHFKGMGWNKGMRYFRPQISLDEILVENSTYQSFKLKKRLFQSNLKKQKCEECGWKKVSKDGRLPLELDHINGKRHDNRIENLRILCPNCHSLKPTHRGLNRKKMLGW